MPLLQGAAGKVILAHLPSARLRGLMLRDPRKIAEAGLGQTWIEFRDALRAIRRQGYAVTYGEIDATTAGIAAPIVGDGQQVLGSLVFAIPIPNLPEDRVPTLAQAVMEGARLLSKDGEPAAGDTDRVVRLHRGRDAA